MERFRVLTIVAILLFSSLPVSGLNSPDSELTELSIIPEVKENYWEEQPWWETTSRDLNRNNIVDWLEQIEDEYKIGVMYDHQPTDEDISLLSETTDDPNSCFGILYSSGNNLSDDSSCPLTDAGDHLLLTSPLGSLQPEAKAGHDLVEHEQRAVIVAKLTQALEEPRSGKNAAHVAGDRLDDDAGDVVAPFLEGGARGGQIVERRLNREPGHRLRNAW